ncbi:hypothetical protein GGU10DRAFT_399912 [Lentinula aff. detonsa]|uniref:Uncharacterized protein n=1 Tax=Lentinula aff. detonsa TaxID=2804958 RepID=A0AA38KKM2_9AGAR|nr:hypothetical protein GGU10DRAFT_399912 [Lentinula aff. detonsa]
MLPRMKMKMKKLDAGDDSFLPNDSDDGEEVEKEDIDELDLNEEDLIQEHVKVVGKKGGYANQGSLIQTVHGNDVDFIPPPSQPFNHDHHSESEASSRVDLSMMPEDDDSEEDEAALIPKQKISKACDAKYIAELPAIVPPSMETRTIQKPIRKQLARSRISHTSHATAAMAANLSSKSLITDQLLQNDDWPNLTALIYPRQQRVISLTAQTQTIQRVLHEAINLAIGLAIFQNGFALTAQQLADSKNSIVLAATKFELPDIVYQFERDDLLLVEWDTYVVKSENAAQELVPLMYSIHQIPVENNACKSFIANLLSRMNFIFPQTNVAESSSICYCQQNARWLKIHSLYGCDLGSLKGEQTKFLSNFLTSQAHLLPPEFQNLPNLFQTSSTEPPSSYSPAEPDKNHSQQESSQSEPSDPDEEEIARLLQKCSYHERELARLDLELAEQGLSEEEVSLGEWDFLQSIHHWLQAWCRF